MSLPAPHSLPPDAWPLLEALLQTVHQTSSPQAYPSEYPLMLSPERSDWLQVIADPTCPRLLSHVGALPRTLRIHQLRLPAALVGSVATHPAARGQGLARQTLEATHARLRSSGILLAILWSDERSLYRTLGYYPAGRSLLFRIESKRPPDPDVSLLCRPAHASDLPGIWQLLSNRFTSLERSLDEHRRLLEVPGVEGYVGVREGRIAAVLYVGKGSDMKDIGHDFAGAGGDVIRLTRWVKDWRGGSMGLLTPDFPEEVASEALALGWPFAVLPVAQVCILDPEALVTSLSPVLSNGELEALRVEDPTAAPLAQRLFGPARPRRSSLLPLPFHIWGLDSM